MVLRLIDVLRYFLNILAYTVVQISDLCERQLRKRLTTQNFLPQTKPDIVSGMANEQSHGVSAFGSAPYLGLSPRPSASPHLLTRTCVVRCEASYGDRVAFRSAA